jgi:hypothetical protein
MHTEGDRRRREPERRRSVGSCRSLASEASADRGGQGGQRAAHRRAGSGRKAFARMDSQALPGGCGVPGDKD